MPRGLDHIDELRRRIHACLPDVSIRVRERVSGGVALDRLHVRLDDARDADRGDAGAAPQVVLAATHARTQQSAVTTRQSAVNSQQSAVSSHD